MREIKFRVWDRVTMMCLGEAIKRDIISYDFQNFYLRSEYPDDVFLMQYTGLKDKNGKEIYEGDIIFDEDGEYSKTIRIDCENNYVQFFGKDIYTDDAFELEKIGDECLIIGNIYENPELLNKRD